MLCSLFSIFDPSLILFNSSIPMKWASLFMIIIFNSWSYFSTPNPMSLLISLLQEMFTSILKPLFYDWKKYCLMILSLFYLILILCESGMMPFMFTAPSHISFNLSLALPMWLSGMLYMYILSIKNAFSHLVPSGCPTVLIPLLVMIESTSLLIRPFSLSIRLMSNMMAGHMVLVLVSDMINSMENMSVMLMYMIMTGFMLFEICVAVIQAYVFSNLLVLYWKESK
nr:ATP synthase F0 subunit 6 [Fulicoffula longipila]